MKKEITSRHNAQLKRAISLRQKKFRKVHGRFLLEGFRAVSELEKAGIDDYELWATPEAAVSSLVNSAKTVYVLPPEWFAELSSTEQPQGIVATVSFSALPAWNETMEGQIAVLAGVQDPGNAGTMVRIAAAVGCVAIFTTKGTVDLFNEKAVRSSMGSLLHLPVREGVTADELGHYARTHHLPVIAAVLTESRPYYDLGAIPAGLWLFGNEGAGLSPEILALADHRCRIPLDSGVESLNVATAAAVFLFHNRFLLERKIKA